MKLIKGQKKYLPLKSGVFVLLLILRVGVFVLLFRPTSGGICPFIRIDSIYSI
jgi:hypothetical protein